LRDEAPLRLEGSGKPRGRS